MTFRVLIPLLTYPDVAPADAVSRALDMAATLGAEVTVLVHEATIPPISEPFANLVIDVHAMAASAEKLSRERGAELASSVRHQAERIALPIVLETVHADRQCGEMLAERARTFDLTILPGLPQSPAHELVRQEILFRSGGPLLVLPSGDGPAHLACVAIGWDGSGAAARAVRDALPVLSRAERVVVLTADGDKAIPAASIANLMTMLAAHDIVAEHLAVVQVKGDIGAALQRAAIDADAGLLVMGAFGHSRMREFILGGATSSVVGSPLMAVLMSH